jgi:hypothetical protein
MIYAMREKRHGQRMMLDTLGPAPDGVLFLGLHLARSACTVSVDDPPIGLQQYP